MKHLLLAFFATLSLCASAQQLSKPSPAVIQTLPLWAQTMYSENPNVFAVDSLYQAWYLTHEFARDYHTNYYKNWRRSVASHLAADGSIIPVTADEVNAAFANPPASRSRSAWTQIGPEKVFAENGNRIGDQTNVFCIAQSPQQSNIVFCGTQPGEIYKSIDGGQNWFLTSINVGNLGEVSSIEIDPTDPNVVYVGAASTIIKTTDGGATWSPLLTVNNLRVNELLINPQNPQIVMAACFGGLYRSTDGGANWTALYTTACYDLKFRPGSDSIVYLLKNNPAQLMCEFFRSADAGATFTIQSTGWYSSSDPARQDMGARLAVTPADPMRIYAFLTGDSKPNDLHYIGVFRSNDGGSSWTLPNPPVGGPYTSTHPNLAYLLPSMPIYWGFLNCAIMVSNTDPDKILIGAINLWRSDDGGATFSGVAGYLNGTLDIHVDMQDFRPTSTGYWLTNDGGINHSNDFFVNDNVIMTDGIHGAEFFGFDIGWNEDVMVGGLYHNGTVAWYQNYTANNFLQLGGAEPPSGYSNPGESRRVYSSDIGGAVMPTSIGQPIERFSVGMWPNETYWSPESGKMNFDPRCYNIVYIGFDNGFWKSTDGGASYNLLHTFGTNVNHKISQTEIAWTNPSVIYTCQNGGSGKLWKTTDAGVTWTQLTIPLPGAGGNRSRLLISLSPADENKIWLAYPLGANGNKVFYSSDGGLTWTNITDSNLDNDEVNWIQHIANTDGGVYCVTEKSVFYRNNTTAAWQPDNTSLPVYLNGLSAKPFYRDGKVKLSSHGRGVWENVLQDQPTAPICQPQVNMLNYVMNCDADTFRFEDHSVLNHAGASWQWSFPGGNPSSSSIRNPSVVYTTPGTYTVTLTVTDSAGQTDSNTLTVTVSAYQQNTNLVQDFQGNFPPAGWWNETVDPAAGNWRLSTAVGGFGNSTQSTIFDNYNFDAQGGGTDLRIRADMTQQPSSMLTFDVAYAPYGGQYMDSLEVLVSTDCGNTFTSVYMKGGAQLSTAPQLTTAIFVPAAAEWRTDSVSLAAWSSSTDLLIAFRNHGYFGQAVYVDNINITNPNGITEPTAVSGAALYPNPALAGQPLTLVAPAGEQ
ncbi:MAG: VPS10 domain-containing protein, partial [Bacteroidia bacterium]